MKILRILYHTARLAEQRWVLRNINPLDALVHKYVLCEKHHDDRLKELMT